MYILQSAGTFRNKKNYSGKTSGKIIITSLFLAPSSVALPTKLLILLLSLQYTVAHTNTTQLSVSANLQIKAHIADTWKCKES